MRLLQHALAAAAFLTATACVDSENTTAPPRAARTPSFNTTSVTELATGPWARIVDGQAGPGALYRLYIPRTWNGDAIYYAHGIRDVNSPVDLREDKFSPVRELLGAQGFAVAYSSWSANGMDFKDAAQRVHQMRGILAAELHRTPSRSFLLGHSMGGGVALETLQTYAGQYDGALLGCGMLGGPRVMIQYVGDVRVLFDVFYPGITPATQLTTPPDAPPVTLAQVTAAVQSNPSPLFLIASLVQTPLAWVPSGSLLNPSSTAFQTLVGSLYTALMQQIGGVDPFYDLTHGHAYFDNSMTMYSLRASPLIPAPVLQPMVDFANEAVARYSADPSAENFLDRYFTPSGDLRVPVLTLDNMWDPNMPTLHEMAFDKKVTAAGATQNLLHRFYPAYGHCVFPPAVEAQAFLDLVNWVTTGVKPTS